MWVQLIVFSAPKEGNRPAEWEDGACGGAFAAVGVGDPAYGRFIVLDGASRSYEARRWVDLLISSFMSPAPNGGAGAPPELETRSLTSWVREMQDGWRSQLTASADYMEQRKLSRGALATFLGGELLGLGGPAPSWRAAALGDTVLFHVRADRLLTHFPPLRSADFGMAPEGLSTQRNRLDEVSDRMLYKQGSLAVGDTLFAATDAFAKWMIQGTERRDEALWPLLSSLTHHAKFTRIVAEQRKAGALEDDDVTLMRIRVISSPPSALVVCL
jgi:hypothetical protein